MDDDGIGSSNGSPGIMPLLGLHKIPHYYGDAIRQLFVAAAILAIISIPIWGDLLPFGLLTQVGCILLLVLLAGITNPHSKMVLLYDAVVSGVGVLLMESAAISLYGTESSLVFIVRELIAIILLFAFYLSVKTVRSAYFHEIGRNPKKPDFQEINQGPLI